MHAIAGQVGRSGRGVRHVQWMLRDSLRTEKEPASALERTRRLLDHLDQDRDLMAETLLVATSEARRHTEVPFDAATLDWLASGEMR